MKNKYFKKISILVLLIGLSLTACSNKDKSPNDSNTSKLIDQGENLNLVLDAEPGTLDPSRAIDPNSNTVLINIMEPLTRLEEDEDSNNILTPAGAESWESNSDGTVWTFKIRDAFWSDGVSVRAQDYEYGIKRSINRKTRSPYAYLLNPIKNAEKVNRGQLPMEELGVRSIDEKTLEISLEKPIPYFLDLTYQRVMLPQREDIVSEHGRKYGSEWDTLVYNGPFTLKSWRHNNQLVLEKNKKYWDRDLVKLEKIKFYIIQDENAVFNSFLNGSVDKVSTHKAQWKDEFTSQEKIKYYEVVQPEINFLLFNTKDEFFRNLNIRKAFQLAIDREDMSNVLFDGTNQAAYGFVSPNIKMAGHEFRDLTDLPILKLYKENKDPEVLLAQGLKELGKDPDPSKITVKISLGSTDQNTKNMAEYLEQVYAEKLGVNFEIHQMKWPLFSSLLDNGEFQIASIQWKADFNDPISFFNLFKSNNGIFNNGWANGQYDENLELADKEMYQIDRLKYFEKCEEILLYEEAAIIPLNYITESMFFQDYVKKPGIMPFSSMGYKYTYID